MEDSGLSSPQGLLFLNKQVPDFLIVLALTL